jgi:hypothetical protein
VQGVLTGENGEIGGVLRGGATGRLSGGRALSGWAWSGGRLALSTAPCAIRHARRQARPTRGRRWQTKQLTGGSHGDFIFELQQLGFPDIGSVKIASKVGKIQGIFLEIEEMIWNNFSY